jgi:hypothetical protein
VQVTALAREAANFSVIRAALRSGEFDLAHNAGHAFFDPLNRTRSGILCHGHTLLSGADLAALEAGRSRVRELPSVDWANYILYGSPEFVLKRRD